MLNISRKASMAAKVAVIEKCNEKFEIGRFNEKGQYINDFQPVRPSTYLVNHIAKLWHRLMEHPSNNVLKEMGLPTSEFLSSFCEECITAKNSSTPVSKSPVASVCR